MLDIEQNLCYAYVKVVAYRTKQACFCKGDNMRVEEKRQAIITAIEVGKVTGRQLEPSRKGATVSRIKKGLSVKDETINKLYARMVELIGNSSQGEQRPAQNVEQKAQAVEQIEQSLAQKPDDNNGELSRALARIADLERENSRLKGEIEQMKAQAESEEKQGKDAMIAQLTEQIEQRFCAIESRLAQIEQSPAQEVEQKAQKPAQAVEQIEPSPADFPGLVMGFKIKEKSTTTAGKVYRKWYATRGKEVVYVGNNPQQAEQKITAYLDRKNER